MRTQNKKSDRSVIFASALLLALLPAIAFADLESTIFKYDGQDFVRIDTTLTKEDGTSAVNTKLSRDDPCYAALVQKHSYSGTANLYGHSYEAH